ncbi:hypothetical protein D3C76_693600 [compost metagenome]
MFNAFQTVAVFIAACRYIFQQRLLFQFECGQLRFQAHNLFRHRIEAHTHTRRRSIQQVNGLVRQLTTGEVAARQRDGRPHRIVSNVHIVMFGIAGFQAPEHQAGGVVVRLVDFYHLKTALQCRIAFKILFVLAPGGGGDSAQFTAGECRLQQVGRIRPARLIACANNGVGFVDKQQNRCGRLLHRVDNVFQALLKFALHARARLQQAKVEGAQAHGFQ